MIRKSGYAASVSVEEKDMKSKKEGVGTCSIWLGPATTTEVRTGSRMLAASGQRPRGCGGAYLFGERSLKLQRVQRQQLVRRNNKQGTFLANLSRLYYL